MFFEFVRHSLVESSHTQAAPRLLIAKALNFDCAITARLQFGAAKPVSLCAAWFCLSGNAWFDIRSRVQQLPAVPVQLQGDFSGFLSEITTFQLHPSIRVSSHNERHPITWPPDVLSSGR